MCQCVNTLENRDRSLHVGLKSREVALNPSKKNLRPTRIISLRPFVVISLIFDCRKMTRDLGGSGPAGVPGKLRWPVPCQDPGIGCCRISTRTKPKLKSRLAPSHSECAVLSPIVSIKVIIDGFLPFAVWLLKWSMGCLVPTNIHLLPVSLTWKDHEVGLDDIKPQIWAIWIHCWNICRDMETKLSSDLIGQSNTVGCHGIPKMPL